MYDHVQLLYFPKEVYADQSTHCYYTQEEWHQYHQCYHLRAEVTWRNVDLYIARFYLNLSLLKVLHFIIVVWLKLVEWFSAQKGDTVAFEQL